MHLVRNIVEVVLALAVGSRCVGCGGRGGGTLCAGCRAELRMMPTAPGAVFVDRGVAARIVRAGKEGRWRGAAAVLAAEATRRWRVGVIDAPAPTLVTWVPADPRRRARRGVHLPEQVARELAHDLGVPARPLLERRRGSPAQRGLDRAVRQRNAAAAFRPGRRGRPPARDDSVLVVDDVRTTGATLRAVVALLAPYAGAITTLAMTGRENLAVSGDFGLTWQAGGADGFHHIGRKVDRQ